MVTLSPAEPPVADMVGVVSFVRLSVLDVPVSLEDAMSGADGAPDAAVSMVMDNAELAVETLPAGSDNVAVTDHVPSASGGRSHEVAGRTYEHETVSDPLVAVIVMVSPVEPPDADMVGVLSLVALSVDEVPRSDAVARSTPVGAVGEVVSTVIDNGELVVDALPAGSVMTEVTDHVPAVTPDMAHDVTFTVTVYVQVLVVPPLTADTVTESPICAPGTVNAGDVELVRLSADEVPESLAARRSGVEEVGAVVSMVIGVVGPAGEMFPDGSVMVADMDQVSSVSAGRSHDVAGRT